MTSSEEPRIILGELLSLLTKDLGMMVASGTSANATDWHPSCCQFCGIWTVIPSQEKETGFGNNIVSQSWTLSGLVIKVTITEPNTAIGKFFCPNSISHERIVFFFSGLVEFTEGCSDGWLFFWLFVQKGNSWPILVMIDCFDFVSGVVEFTEGCSDWWLFCWLFFLEKGSLGIIGWGWLLMAYSSYWLFGLCYAMDWGYRGWNPCVERHLAIFVNCFWSKANSSIKSLVR